MWSQLRAVVASPDVWRQVALRTLLTSDHQIPGLVLWADGSSFLANKLPPAADGARKPLADSDSPRDYLLPAFVSPTVVPIQTGGMGSLDASRPAGASREHDTHQLHAMAPGLMGQTIERAGGSKKDAARSCQRQDPG